MQRAVLLTGGTGFVGSYLAAALMREGAFLVFLARGKADKPAADRVADVLRWHGHTDPTTYTVADGDIVSPRFGLAEPDYARLAGICGEIWHCASETSFSERKRPLLQRVNVEGTRHVLAFAADSGATMVNYVSSSYAVGKVTGRCPETLIDQSDFHNPYEETKHAAEKLLHTECDRHGLPYLIYRPSIIIGESGSGRTLAFRGMYYPLRMLDYLRNMLLLDLKENGGANAADVGARIDDDSKLVMPLRVVTGSDDRHALNLVPIDYVIECCLRIRAHGRPGTTYHIANDTPVTLIELVEFIEDHMDIRGVRVASANEVAQIQENVLEQRFRSLITVYLPYLCDRRIFATDNTRAVLDRYGMTCPRIDQVLLARCISYATGVGWMPPA